MSLVEDRYNQALDAMSGAQRVQRTASLFASMKEMLALQITREYGSLDPRTLQIKIAERLYLTDRGAQMLLAKVARP